MAQSSPFVPGAVLMASDLNALRADVLDSDFGHTHDGVDGRRFSHSNLLDSGTYTHSQIDGHMDADMGVHGVSGYLVGAPSALKIQAGVGQVLNGDANGFRVADVTFPESFASAPYVVVSPFNNNIVESSGQYSSSAKRVHMVVGQVTTTGFKVAARFVSETESPLSFYWIAVGGR